jgi:hypothetical protein
VGDQPLRLNSEPVPADAMPPAIGDHAACVASALAWLEGQCGDYAPLRRQFIVAYFRWINTEIDAHQAELMERLEPYDGLYRPQDFFWSALRPLPRGWVAVGDRYLPADVVFWDGTLAIAITLSARDTERQKALLAAGITVCDGEPSALPAQFRQFWHSQPLPSSPFHRLAPSPPRGAERVGETWGNSTTRPISP